LSSTTQAVQPPAALAPPPPAPRAEPPNRHIAPPSKSALPRGLRPPRRTLPFHA
jgi:hypothetical protein